MRLHQARDRALDWRTRKSISPHERLVTWMRPQQPASAPTGHKLFNFFSTPFQSRRWAHIKRKEMKKLVSSKWRFAAFVLGVAVASQCTKILQINSQLKNVYYYDIAVTVKDKDTGAILESVTTHGPGTSSRDLFNQSSGYTGDPLRPQISGVAYEPREYGFSKTGYARKNVMVTDNSKSSITVELEPKKPNNADMATPRKPSDQF
jgi:hypothetical protein